jgi:transcriptional regulator with XRE-family HTH domain
MNIGGAIRILRVESGISQEGLSEKTGLSQTSISQIENGVKTPTKKSIEKICNALGITEAMLYIMAIEKSDVPKNKKDIYNELFPKIKGLINEMMSKG